MSNYDQAADKAKKQLDKISPTMCYAKWSQVSMHLHNGMTHSCYHPPTHKVDLEELKLMFFDPTDLIINNINKFLCSNKTIKFIFS